MNVNKEEYTDKLQNCLIPAIMVPESDQPIFIQQDNAGPYINPKTNEVVQSKEFAASMGYFNELVFRPPKTVVPT